MYIKKKTCATLHSIPIDKIQILEIKDQTGYYGSFTYDKNDDAVYFVDKQNIKHTLINKPRQISHNDKLDNSLSYHGIWDVDTNYKINSLVKYNNQFYISKNNINNKLHPIQNIEWELFQINNMDDLSQILDLTYASQNQIHIHKQIITLHFKLSGDIPVFADYINASHTLLLKQFGSYQITYNLTFASKINYVTVFLLLSHDTTQPITKSISRHIINSPYYQTINHTFILNLNKNINKKNCFKDNDMDFKLLMNLHFNSDAINQQILINPDETWIQIKKL